MISSGVLYIDKSTIYLFHNKTARVYRLDFPPQIIRDLEVLNEGELQKQIKLLIETNKIEPLRLTTVLSENLIFEKEFSLSEAAQIDNQIQKFIDAVPFESVEVKTIKHEKGLKIIVVNKHFFESIKNAFQKSGFHIELVLPYFVFGKDIAFTNGLNQAAAKVIVKKSDSLKEYSLLFVHEELSAGKEEEKSFFTSGKNKRLKLLLALFALLIIVLSFILYITINTQPVKTKKLPPKPLEVTPTIKILTPVPTNISSSSAILKEDLKIEILNSSGITGEAERMKKRLISTGFKNIAVKSSNIIGSKTLIIFSKEIPVKIREEITGEVRIIYDDAVSQESQEINQYDVIITIGKIL